MAINTSIVTSKAAGIISENFKPSYAIPASALTPSTLTAMVGLARGSALKVPDSVTGAISDMASKAALFGNSLSPSYNPTVASALSDAQSALSTLSGKLMPSGNPAAFGQTLMAAQAHIADAIELKTAANFMSNTSFGNMGSGVKDMASVATQGLNNELGDLGKAASAFAAAGPAFDLKDISNFGSPVGLINKLSSVKLGNASGITAALGKAGVDLTKMNDPVYASSITKAMGSITDPKIIYTITKQRWI